MQLGPATTVVNMPQLAHMIGPLGCQWKHDNGTSIDVPAGAVPEMTRFEHQWMFKSGQPDDAPAGKLYANRAFEMKAFRFGEVYEFDRPITIRMRLNAGEIVGLKRASLKFWYRESPGDPWKMAGEPAWSSEDEISFSANHFNQFALFGNGAYSVHLPIIGFVH